MKIFKKCKKSAMFLMALVLITGLLMPGSFAYASSDTGSGDNIYSNVGEIDTSRNGTLTIYYYYAGYGVMAGVNAHIYRLASFDKLGNFTVIDPFTGLGLDITDMSSISTSEQWNSIITAATTYINSNGITPYATAAMLLYLRLALP